MTRKDLINIAERSLWTFIEAFMAALTVVEITDWSLETLEVALLSGVAAVVAVIKNVAATYVAKLREPGD